MFDRLKRPKRNIPRPTVAATPFPENTRRHVLSHYASPPTAIEGTGSPSAESSGAKKRGRCMQVNRRTRGGERGGGVICMHACRARDVGPIELMYGGDGMRGAE